MKGRMRTSCCYTKVYFVPLLASKVLADLSKVARRAWHTRVRRKISIQKYTSWTLYHNTALDRTTFWKDGQITVQMLQKGKFAYVPPSKVAAR